MVTRKLEIALMAIAFVFMILPVELSSQTNWQEYYPLHIGDFWEYQGNSNNIPITITEIVLRDTLMPNGILYRMVRYKEHNGPFPHESLTFKRVDTLGRVWYYQSGDCLERLVYKLNGQTGDTLKNSCNPSDPSFWRLVKREPAIVFDDTTETQTWDWINSPLLGVNTLAGRFGLIIERGEFWERSLRGAIIGGKKKGDFTVSVNDNLPPLVQTFTLKQNYPNPFNSRTIIKYSLSQSSQVRLVIYSVLGREVMTLLNEYRNAGAHQINFNASSLTSGVYFYGLETAGKTVIQKMMLMK